MTDPNPYEQAARQAKVDQLAAWLVATMRRMPGVTDDQARDAAVRFCDRANAAAWKTAAAEAGVNPPSATTVAALRARLVADRDAYRSAPADPFAGLPSL